MTLEPSQFRQAIIENTLRSCQLFVGLPAADIVAIASFIVSKHLDKGEYLFREGDRGDGFYVVQKGAINVHRVNAAGKEQVIHLTPAEGRLLRVLIENPGRVYSHRELVLLVQGYDTSQREAPEILRPLVSRPRHKLESFPSLSDRIVSVRGTGYLYESEK